MKSTFSKVGKSKGVPVISITGHLPDLTCSLFRKHGYPKNSSTRSHFWIIKYSSCIFCVRDRALIVQTYHLSAMTPSKPLPDPTEDEDDSEKGCCNNGNPQTLNTKAIAKSNVLQPKTAKTQPANHRAAPKVLPGKENYNSGAVSKSGVVPESVQRGPPSAGLTGKLQFGPRVSPGSHRSIRKQPASPFVNPRKRKYSSSLGQVHCAYAYR